MTGKWTVKPGDLLYVDENKTVGIVYRETPKKIWYYAFGENGLGGPFGVSKDMLYQKIDEGVCLHQIGKTKYRRTRE